jgi:DNA-binding transcriptional ArsR family regulator
MTWSFDLVDTTRSDPGPGPGPDPDRCWLEVSPVTPDWSLWMGLAQGSRPSEARDALGRYADIAVHPYWGAIEPVMESARIRLVRLVGERGVEGALSALHPSIAWRPPVLEVEGPGVEAAHHDLGGSGLVVVLSFFGRAGAPGRSGRGRATPQILVVPVTPGLSGFTGIWSVAGANGASLEALLGRTRAAALQSVGIGPCTTTELARRCGISLSSASQHATVLRGAGLIRTERRRGAVLHDLTALGEQILDGPDAPSPSVLGETLVEPFGPG